MGFPSQLGILEFYGILSISYIYPKSGRIFQSFSPESLEPFSAHIGQRAPCTVSPNHKGSTQMLMMLGFKKHLVLFAELRFELTRCAQRETAPGQAVVHNGCLQVKSFVHTHGRLIDDTVFSSFNRGYKVNPNRLINLKRFKETQLSTCSSLFS